MICEAEQQSSVFDNLDTGGKNYNSLLNKHYKKILL